MSQPVILAAKRTPVGRFMGGLSRVPAPQLGAYAIQAVLEQLPDIHDQVDECIMGCVLQAGLGQNPARNAGLQAGLPHTLNAHTTNKVCGSGLQSVMIGATAIKAGDGRVHHRRRHGEHVARPAPRLHARRAQVR
jgi:acetyl-CoA C-acetyltransferase